MRFSENFEAAKNMAVEAAQTAAAKAKELAAIAKANISIYAEEDKVKKAEIELGKLYYRDYAVGEELDTAEYLPWCQKIDESKKLIAELKDYIDDVKAADEVPAEAPAARKETAATSWLTRMPVENRYKLSVRSPSIHTRPRPYHAT